VPQSRSLPPQFSNLQRVAQVEVCAPRCDRGSRKSDWSGISTIASVRQAKRLVGATIRGEAHGVADACAKWGGEACRGCSWAIPAGTAARRRRSRSGWSSRNRVWSTTAHVLSPYPGNNYSYAKTPANGYQQSLFHRAAHRGRPTRHPADVPPSMRVVNHAHHRRSPLARRVGTRRLGGVGVADQPTPGHQRPGPPGSGPLTGQVSGRSTAALDRVASSERCGRPIRRLLSDDTWCPPLARA